ncbi:MAG: CpsD/CapB family tyrosine-protein kinase [Thermodesulfobacteriota bacterium]|nr:CpsD/CapB family tyrosine-protein kinase [Thermodesulfobacteriota bacterium]
MINLRRQYPLPDGKKSKLYEAYYSMANKLKLLDKGGRSGSAFLITSAVVGEGKTYTAINLACNLALSQKRVLLVDANSWSPMLTARFNQEKKVGFHDSLKSLEIVEKRPLPHDFPGLYLMGIGADSGEDLIQALSDHFGSWLSEARKVFDTILLDSPAVNFYGEARVLTPLADGVLLVVKALKTHIREILKARDAIREADGNLLGAVLNGYLEYIPKSISSWL